MQAAPGRPPCDFSRPQAIRIGKAFLNLCKKTADVEPIRKGMIKLATNWYSAIFHHTPGKNRYSLPKMAFRLGYSGKMEPREAARAEKILPVFFHRRRRFSFGRFYFRRGLIGENGKIWGIFAPNLAEHFLFRHNGRHDGNLFELNDIIAYNALFELRHGICRPQNGVKREQKKRLGPISGASVEFMRFNLYGNVEAGIVEFLVKVEKLPPGPTLLVNDTICVHAPSCINKYKKRYRGIIASCGNRSYFTRNGKSFSLRTVPLRAADNLRGKNYEISHV